MARVMGDLFPGLADNTTLRLWRPVELRRKACHHRRRKLSRITTDAGASARFHVRARRGKLLAAAWRSAWRSTLRVIDACSTFWPRKQPTPEKKRHALFSRRIW